MLFPQIFGSVGKYAHPRTGCMLMAGSLAANKTEKKKSLKKTIKKCKHHIMVSCNILHYVLWFRVMLKSYYEVVLEGAGGGL